MPPKSRTPASITYIVRFVEDSTFNVRTFHDREAAELFMRLTFERGGDVRSWAEVSTVEQSLPEFVLVAKQAI